MRKIFLFLFAAVLSIGTAMAEVVTITGGDHCILEYVVDGENSLVITGSYFEEPFALTLIGELDMSEYATFTCDVQEMNIANYSKYANRGTATVMVYPAGIEISATGLYDSDRVDQNTYNLDAIFAFAKSSAGGDDIPADAELTVDMTGLEATFDPLLTFAASGLSTDMSLGAELGTVVTYLECSWAEVDGAYPVDLANSYLTLADHGMVGEVLGGSVVPVMDESIPAIVSATAVVYVYFADLESTLKFTLNMTAGASEEPGGSEESNTVSVQVWNAELSQQSGTLMVNGSMNGVAVHAEVPGFTFVADTWESFDYSNVSVEVGTWGESDYVGNAMGDATVELDQHTVTIQGKLTAGDGTQFDVYIQGSLQPANPMESTTLTMEGMTKTEGRQFIQLEDDNYNTIEIYSFEYGDYLKVTAGFDEPLEGYGSWKNVDGVETLVATLYDDYYTKVYHVTATASAQQMFTITSSNATYVVDPEFGDVIFSGVAEEGGEFEIMVGNTVEGQYAYGIWGETEIVATEITDFELDIMDDTYYFGGSFQDAEGNTYDVWVVAAPAAVEPTPDYTRDVTSGSLGTICLPFGSTNYTGATFYEVVGKEDGKVYLGSVEALVAGVPYIFEASASELAVYSDGTTAATPGSANGLIGNFTDETVVPTGNYILYENAFIPADGTTNKVNAYRAYLDLSAVTGGKPQPMPGRRYIGMGVQGENEATGFENITAPEGQTIKAIENGQLIIIRGGEMYNVQGQKL